MRSVVKILAILFIVFVIMILQFIHGFYAEYTYEDNIQIRKGDSLSSFIARLPDYPYAAQLKILFYIKGGAERIQKGTYDLSKGVNCFEIRSMITAVSDINYKAFTIIPGEDMRQLEKRVDEMFPGSDLMKELALKKKEFEFLEYGYEGMLYPDTYFYNKESGQPLSEVLELALQAFRDNIILKYKDFPNDITLFQACILASIVEAEGREFEEKRLISGVFLNRIKKNMYLESCATVQYALPKRKKRLLYKDIEINSPYNTYRNRGLPPGPICFFSEQSMKAVIEFIDHDYLYFVLMKNGKHKFSRTLEEHNRAKRQ